MEEESQMKSISRDGSAVALTLISMALLMIFSPLADAQIGRASPIRVTPSISGITVSGAGIGSRSFDGLGIKTLPSGNLQVGGFTSAGGVIKRYESSEIEFQGGVCRWRLHHLPSTSSTCPTLTLTKRMNGSNIAGSTRRKGCGAPIIGRDDLALSVAVKPQDGEAEALQF